MKHISMQYISLIFIAISSFFIFNTAQAQNFSWAKQVTNNCEISDVVEAPNGDLLIAGEFGGEFDFNPNDGIVELISVNNRDQFIIRVSPAGELLWVMQLDGYVFLDYIKLAVDANGDFYVAGQFSDSFDFDFSDADVTLTSAGSSGGYVAKYSANRDLIWVNQIDTESGFIEISSLMVDSDFGVYLGGYLQTELQVNGTSVISTGNSLAHGFLLKFNTEGSYAWGGAMSENTSLNDLALTNEGKIIVVGKFFASNDVDLDPNTTFELTSVNTGFDVYFSIYNPDGTLADARGFESNDNDEAERVAVDANGNIIIVGQFRTVIGFNPITPTPGNNMFTAGFTDGTFLAKFNPELDCLWERQIGVSSDTFFNDLAIDNSGGIWTTGIFEGTANFDPLGAESLTSQGNTDAFLSWIDTDGNYMFGGQFTGSSNYERARALTVSNDGSVYVVGDFLTELDLDFGNEPPVFTAEPGTGSSGFIVKYTGAPLSANKSPLELNLVAYPNPTMGVLIIETSRNLSNARLQVINQLGQTVSHSYRMLDQRIYLEMNGKDGLYFLQLSWPDGTSSSMKVIKKS